VIETDPFWTKVKEAYLQVAADNSLTVTVEVGFKHALVRCGWHMEDDRPGEMIDDIIIAITEIDPPDKQPLIAP
jgi:hypothetical protein